MVRQKQRREALSRLGNEDTCDVTYLVGERGIVVVEAIENRLTGGIVTRSALGS
jgi:hypothetical protein